MTGLDRNQTPKTRPMPQKRTALVASLDIGTSKIACMIARLKPCPPSDALRGRSHAVELIGYSQIQSHGVKAGAVVDLAECEQAVRQAVALLLPPTSPVSLLPACATPPARAAPCCMRYRSVTHSMGSRAFAIRAAWWRGNSAST